jgi:L-threonylcarbamoyladenylate synthase
VPYREVSRGVAALRGRGSVGLISINHPGPGLELDSQQTLPDDPARYARGLYAAIRDVDAALANLPAASADTVILIEMPPDRPEWAAVRDRLLRATRPLEGDVTSTVTGR